MLCFLHSAMTLSLSYSMLYNVATTGIGTGGIMPVLVTFSVPGVLVVAVYFVDICHANDAMFGCLCRIK